MVGVPQRRSPTIVRYLAKVDRSAGNDGCWPWTGAKDQDGYGIFWDGTYRPNGQGRYVRVTRWTYEQFIGRIPEGRQLLHACDNPPCVNPAHLSFGTCADNHGQREARGRGVRAHGSSHVGAKLTEAEVIAIRERRSAGVPQIALAREYGVSAALICNIVKRKVWTHV